jgi:hypothetical protein
MVSSTHTTTKQTTYNTSLHIEVTLPSSPHLRVCPEAILFEHKNTKTHLSRPKKGTSTNHKFGRTVCNFANFGRTNMIQVGIPLVLLFLIVSLLWIFFQVSFW